MTEYRTIVADPPWPYSSRDAITRSIKKGGDPAIGVGDTGYEFMDMDALCAVSVPASDNAHLYLWTTNAFMVQAHELATAWGFKPKTILTWVKTHQNDVARVSMKAGYYFRGATEHCIFAVRGSLKLPVSYTHLRAHETKANLVCR